MMPNDLRYFCFPQYPLCHSLAWDSSVANYGHLAGGGHRNRPLFFDLLLLQASTQGAATEPQ